MKEILSTPFKPDKSTTLIEVICPKCGGNKFICSYVDKGYEMVGECAGCGIKYSLYTG